MLTRYRGGKKGFRLLADGIFGIKDIPDGFPLTENQEVQRRVAKSDKPHVSKVAIKTFLHQLEYPVSYLDFETFGTAIPLIDRTRPYEQVPFQFSLHVVGSPGTKPKHHMFLADGRVDPRPDFLQRLPTDYYDGTQTWWDMPASRHNQGANLCFADGHAEHWKWVVPKVFSDWSQWPQAVPAAEMPDWIRVKACIEQTMD